ncbi:putative uncharacterized protein DDB_G0286901 [Achroia grisella]|uniref:putative uncharacterized protein DDB_G0286901 n=1 Tax=Achroia grisella TaxID=688607 RepID=UPI0027D327B2|nr:putative uncharacterized protein DDB_G0286901 [Achroia grisella]
MNSYSCLSLAVILQFASAQVLSYDGSQLISSPAFQNFNGNRQNLNSISNANNIGLATNNILPMANINAANNIINANQLTNMPIGNNFANANSDVFRNNLLTNNFGNNLEVRNLFNNNLANSVANSNLANAVANANLVNANVANINLANGYNINSGKFEPVNNPTFAQLVAAHNSGVQLLADGLQVGGALLIRGQYPIQGTVGVNGNLESRGMASVLCNT